MTDHAHELRRYARKIAHPAGDVPAVMRAAADEIERLAARLEAAEKERNAAIERLDKAKSALRQHHNLAMGEGFDPSHVLTKLRVSAYQQTNLFVNTVSALEESK